MSQQQEALLSVDAQVAERIKAIALTKQESYG